MDWRLSPRKFKGLGRPIKGQDIAARGFEQPFIHGTGRQTTATCPKGTVVSDVDLARLRKTIVIPAPSP
jgi:hypothetical protein